jgi:MFS transporter, ACS family, hexuronate transporter
MTQTDRRGADAGPVKADIPATGWYRWLICALLFAATGLLYVDRQTIGFLKPELSAQYGWDQADYAMIVRSFMVAYAIGFVVFGRVIDVLGAKRGYIIAVVIWTSAHLACSLLGFLSPSVMLVSFMVTQAVLGLGQGGNFPAALKVVAEWFPQRERAFAIGIFNAGSNVGAIITPLLVPFVMLAFGWQWAFVATGALSLLWLVVWIPFYGRPAESKGLSKPELAYIESDPYVPVKQLPWLKVLKVKETWAYALGKLLTDPVWFFYLFWLPPYFFETYKSDVSNISGVALPVIVIYVISDVGSVFGGWMSSAMIKAGASVNVARKLSMLICACCVLPVAFGTYIFHDLWTVTVIIGIAAAAHQAFSANLMALTSDLMPKQAVGSCSGIGGTAGAIGGIIMTLGVAAALKNLGGYSSVFLVAGLIYLFAVLVIHIITPKLKPATFGAKAA